MNKLVRVTFDAIKGHETDKGVCYYSSNDKARKETIVRRSQIVQEVELGLADSLSGLGFKIKHMEADRHAAWLAGNTKRVEVLDGRLATARQAHTTLSLQENKTAQERYEYGVVIAGRVSITDYDAYVWNKENGFDVVRRPIGEWEEA